MDLEASIVERLEKLRQWQIEQQERLLKQQQIQRELLTHKQDCIYKALELSIQELDLDPKSESGFENADNNLGMNIEKLALMCETPYEGINSTNTSNCGTIDNDKNNNSSECLMSEQQPIVQLPPISKSTYSNEDVKGQTRNKSACNAKNLKNLSMTPEKQGRQISNFLMDGVAPLRVEKTSSNRISIDDMPIPSPRKDFQSLLEERLKDCENVSHGQANANPKVAIKKPFLRKGQGLSRFRLNQASESSEKYIRPRSKSMSAMTRSISKHDKNHDVKHKDTSKPSKNVQSKKSIPKVAQQQLCLKNVPQPKRKIRSKSESSSNAPESDPVNRPTNGPELNTSDFSSKSQREMEEVRIFELLEEKAEDSSFCSTSSAVVAFLQQSTPYKLKKKVYDAEANIVNIKQQVSPRIKVPGGQSVLTKISHYEIMNGVDSTQCMNQQNFKVSLGQESKTAHNSHADLQVCNGYNKMDTNTKNSALRNHIQHIHNQQNCYDYSNSINTNEVDVSLHVRFSEYNEYKTIGLTDTSTISNESSMTKSFADDKVWDDSFSPETSETEVLSIKQKPSLLPAIERHTSNCDTKFVQYNASDESDDINYGSEIAENMCKIKELVYNKLQEDVYRTNEESEFSDVITQLSDDEQTILNDSSNHDVHLQINDKLNKYSDNDITKKISKFMNTPDDKITLQDNMNTENSQETDTTMFKSELLKNRLLELEREIDIFRKENAALSLQRQKIQEDHRKWHREYAEKEKVVEEYKRQTEDRLQEERKKLTREKVALESRIRDSQEKAQQSKLERQEIQNLKQELEQVKDEMSTKESRWNAAQSRQKCQMRILKMENTKLKQEIERLQNLKKNVTRSKNKPGVVSNSKAIHQINKQLNMHTKEIHKVADNSSSDSDQKLVEPMMEAIGMGLDTKRTKHIPSEEIKADCEHDTHKSNKHEALQKTHHSMMNVTKKRNLYEHLLKDATSEISATQEKSKTLSTSNIPKLDTNQTKKLDKRRMHTESEYVESNRSPDKDAHNNYHNTSNDAQLHSPQNDYATYTSTKTSERNHSTKLTETVPEELSPLRSAKHSASAHESSCKVDTQGTREIVHPDGRLEYWYSNGNVKKIFPDQGITKMIYYNGDVRETEKDGKVKYFYASTRTWHTTMPDGLELLEFPDGQVERRSHNGTVEVSFPDGSIRIVQSDGSEKWALTDGTIVQTFSNGEKILILPNGQREIHTKVHKRREYPDGTVKLVYPDGTQETRYANGRTRLKDKDGNLLMDSYQ